MAEVTLKLLYLAGKWTANRTNRHFRAQGVFISFLPSCFDVGYQTEMGPWCWETSANPTKLSGVCVWERRRNRGEETWFSFLLGEFSFPKWDSSQPWCTQVVSHQPGLPAAPLFSWPRAHSEGDRPEHSSALQFQSVSRTLCSQVTQSTGTSELLEHPEGPTAWQELEQSVLCSGTAVPLLPLAAPCQSSGMACPGELSFLAFLKEAIPTLHRSRTNARLLSLFSSTNKWLWAELRWDL